MSAPEWLTFWSMCSWRCHPHARVCPAALVLTARLVAHAATSEIMRVCILLWSFGAANFLLSTVQVREPLPMHTLNSAYIIQRL